jgi:ribokinase
MMPRILVLGSLNLDLVLHVPRMPVEGETLPSTASATLCGGKGANQAVACARMGAAVSMIGRVGDDPAGLMLRTALAEESIELAGVLATPNTASGVAVIFLTPDGQNRIVLVPGANAALSPGDVAAHDAAFADCALLLCQLEAPLETVAAAIERAHAVGKPVLLNPAPARALPSELLARTDYLIPNESEATLLTGIAVTDAASAAEAALKLRGQGAGHVIVTLGAGGILIADRDGCRHMPALPARVVDTTAAGDSFIGGFAAGLVEGLSVDDAARLGLAAARVCISRLGAQAALPYRAELSGLTEMIG